MAEPETCRVLICGDVHGKLKSLYTRVNKVIAVVGSFEALFCIGDFFGEKVADLEYFIENSGIIPIPTYVVCPTTSTALRFITDLSGCELCYNLKFLGQQGTYTTISGLRVVYVNVNPDVEADVDTWVTEFPTLEADPSFNGVDLLLTCQWPKHVVPSDDPMSSKVEECSSHCVAHIAKSVKPRYHFAASNAIFYERKPYRNHQVLQEREKLVTRFIGLAAVGNKGNAKFLYALNIKPVERMSQAELVSQPPDATENPYFQLAKIPIPPTPRETEVQTEQYFYALPRKRGADGSCGDRKGTNWKLKKYENTDQLASTGVAAAAGARGQDACWFCLGNPQVAKHLLVTIATQAYVALPRGPLVKDHVLILTVGHHQSWLTCPEVVRKDIDAYKHSLRDMYKKEGKVMVAFERNFKTHHYQLQVVPVPFAVAGEIKTAFIQMSKTWPNSPCILEPLPKASTIDDFCKPGIPYFYVELPTGEKLFSKVDREVVPSADINFGRAVLASESILGCSERINWRDCTEDQETETELTLDFRDRFSEFDFA